MSCRTFAGCVHAMNVSIPECSTRRCTLQCASPEFIVHPTDLPKWQGDGNPVRGGPVIPNEALSVGTFNARRLWYGDGSLHDGFRVLTHILSVGLFLSCASRRSRLENSLRFQLTSLSTMTAPRGLPGARQHFLCVMECAVSQSQV